MEGTLKNTSIAYGQTKKLEEKTNKTKSYKVRLVLDKLEKEKQLIVRVLNIGIGLGDRKTGTNIGKGGVWWITTDRCTRNSNGVIEEKPEN